VNLRWASNANPQPTISSANWTQGGVNVKAINGANGNLIGTPANITYNAFHAFATITNSEAVAVSYSNVNLYVDADSSNYTLDNFDTAGGTQVGSNISFSLNPGDSQVFDLGIVDPSKYELVTGTGSSSSINTDFTFDMAEANMVPEPGVGALIVGAIFLIRAGKRTRLQGS
jgi:hypothetical protein